MMTTIMHAFDAVQATPNGVKVIQGSTALELFLRTPEEAEALLAAAEARLDHLRREAIDAVLADEITERQADLEDALP